MAHLKISVSAARASVLASITLAIGVLACTRQAAPATPTLPPAAAPSAQGPITVHATTFTGAIGGAGQMLAESAGYFAQEGLAIDVVKTDPSTTLAAMLAGQIDVAGLGMDAGLFSAVQRGVDLRIVAPQASSEPDANANFLVVRKDLMDSGKVREYADLRGLKIAVSARGNSSEYVAATALEAGGLTFSDANVVVMTFPDMVSALKSKAIDVAVLNEPQVTLAVQNGDGVKWKGYAEVVPGIQQTVIIFSPQFASQREVATNWMIAYLRGVRDYNDAFVKNTHRAQTSATLESALDISPLLFDAMSFNHIDPDGKLNVSAMEAQMRWSVQMGYLSSPIDLEKVVDPSFVAAAIAQLGPYK